MTTRSFRITRCCFVFRLAILLCLAGMAAPLPASTRYVNIGNPAPAPPYATWATAATNIQDAIDAAAAGDEIVVTNGMYATGGRAISAGDGASNRVAVAKAVTVRSVNGPGVTTIEGMPMRCAYVGSNAILSGFTLTNGFVETGSVTGEIGGGGVWAEASGVVTNCVIVGNHAYSEEEEATGGGVLGGKLFHCSLRGNVSSTGGGGAHGSTLCDCVLVGNFAGQFGGGASDSELYNCLIATNFSDSWGGGVFGSTLYNCVVVGNYADGSGGGASESTLYNCTLVGNRMEDDEFAGGGAINSTLFNTILYHNIYGDYYHCTLNYCCSRIPAAGLGNITNEPAFVDLAAGNFRLRPNSPCIDAGTNLSTYIHQDLDGRPRPFDGNGDGQAAFDIGAYEYRTPLLVWQDSSNPTSPYSDWATAARTIQDAMDAALAGDEILVTNGLYATGGRVLEASGATTNRVAVTAAVTLRSVNGPETTVIFGDSSPGNGARCAYLTPGAVLIGFTLTNGFAAGPTNLGERIGGGVWCETTDAVISNCVLAGNAALRIGGGVYQGTLRHCTLVGNTADGGGGAWKSILTNCRLIENRAGDGGGASRSSLTDCLIEGNSADEEGGGDGGGAFECTLTNCTFNANSANGDGGGAAFSKLERCKLFGNFADSGGGGTVGCALNNCLLAGNSAVLGGGAFLGGLNHCTVVANFASTGGGAKDAYLVNCIAYSNVAGSSPNYDGGAGNVQFSCTMPFPVGGTGNITNAPAFRNAAAGDYRLAFGSPCIDTGTDLSGAITGDLDGRTRPLDGNGDGIAAFDMGAYEHRLSFVSPSSPNPSWPFATWATAAHELHQTMDEEFDSVLVTNGVFARLAIDANVHVQSINGPAVTVIDGAGAGRCLIMDGGAVLSGFTVRHGFAFDGVAGGGALCHPDAILTNCIIEWNCAGREGGGVFGGKLHRCVLRNNESWDSDGGGASHAELHECLLTGNACYNYGGGVSESTLFNCIITRNHADWKGGGANLSTLYHCTLAGNGDDNNSDNGCCTSGATYSGFYNCISVDDLYACGASFSWVPSSSIPGDCCGNIHSPPPMFVEAASGDYRLRPGSPCIDAGTNLSALVSFDFNGLPRPLDGNRDGQSGFDMGAHEFNPLFFTSITRVGNNTRFCWFDTPVGMQLQAAPSLINSVWTNVPVAAGTNCVEFSPGSSSGFFRLVQP